MACIKALEESDIQEIVAAFAQHKWMKPASLFEEYLAEQEAGERLIWVALHVGSVEFSL